MLMRPAAISIERRTPCMALVELETGRLAAFTRPILGVVVKVVFSLFCRICCQRRHCCGSAPILFVYVYVLIFACVCLYLYICLYSIYFPRLCNCHKAVAARFLLFLSLKVLSVELHCSSRYRYHRTRSFNFAGLKCSHCQ